MRIVDTPGYNVKNYQDNDEKIAQTIRQLIEDKNGIKELDMICYVLNSCSSNSLVEEFPNFDSFLSIFGEDVKDNINLVLTFPVGRVPDDVDGFKYRMSKKKISDKPLNHHSFNNFDKFCPNGKQHSSSFSLWDVTKKNFEHFFHELSTMNAITLSIHQNC